MDKVCPECGKKCTWHVNYVQAMHAFIFRYYCDICNLSDEFAVSEKMFVTALDNSIYFKNFLKERNNG